MSAGAVDREFLICIFSRWLSFCVFGAPLASLGATLGALGATLGALALSLGALGLGLLLGMVWLSWDCEILDNII